MTKTEPPIQDLIKKLEALKVKYCPLGIHDKNWRYANGINDAIAALGDTSNRKTEEAQETATVQISPTIAAQGGDDPNADPILNTPYPTEMLIVDGLTFGQRDVDNLVAIYNHESFTTPLQESLFRAIKVCNKQLKPVSRSGCTDCGHTFNGHYEKCRWFEKPDQPDQPRTENRTAAQETGAAHTELPSMEPGWISKTNNDKQREK